MVQRNEKLSDLARPVRTAAGFLFSWPDVPGPHDPINSAPEKIAMSDQDSNPVWGGDAIGKVLGIEKRKTYHLLENGYIPATKVGNTWVAKRDELRDPFTWPRKGGEAVA